VSSALEDEVVVVTRSGVASALLIRRGDQELELCGLDRTVDIALSAVTDAQLQLTTWQYEACQRLSGLLYAEFLNADTVETRLLVVGQAGAALDELETQ